MKKKIFALPSLLIASILCAAAANASNYLQQGIDEYNKGHYMQALDLFGFAKSSDSDNPLLHYYRANTLVRLNYKTDAIREYKLATDLQPQGKIAEYCLSALRSLGAAPAGSAPSAAASAASTQASSKSAPAAPLQKLELQQIQQPQVICIVDDLAHSSRVDLIVTNLQTLFGDIILFKRSTTSSPDEKTKEILKRYNIRKTPAIILVGDDGNPQMQFAGDDIVEDSVHKQVEQLARNSRWKEPGVAQDPHLVEYRHEVLSELEARIGEDQLRVDREIKDIQNAVDEQIAGMTPINRRAPSNASSIEQVKQEAAAKIQAIRDDFEKRKTDWRTAAQARIQARKR